MLSRSVRIVARRGFSSVPATFLAADEVTSRVLGVMKSIKSVPPTVAPESSFAELGFDSLIRKDFWMKLEDEFCVEISSKDATAFKSAGDAASFIAKHPKAR